MNRYECACGRDFATSGGRATHQRTCKAHAEAGAAETSELFDAAPAPEQNPLTAAITHLRQLVAKLTDPEPAEARRSGNYYYYGGPQQTHDDRKNLSRLDTLQSIIEAATAEQHRIVRHLREVDKSQYQWNREARATWEEIGAALGISKQLASHRFKTSSKVKNV